VRKFKAISVAFAAIGILLASPITAGAAAPASENASCLGAVSAGLSTGAAAGLDRAQFEHIIQGHAAIEQATPGSIISAHAQVHGGFSVCFGS
jgi:hypothetical protein